MQSVPPTSRFCLRHEEEAEGPVSAVFRDVRRRMPFVPALFKALAFDPGALETAWLQARALYDDPRAAEAAGRVAALARPELSYRPSPKVRETVAPFLAEIPTMLLVVSSLGLSLDGELELSPPPPPALPEPGPLPETPVPEERGEHPLFDEVRAAYGTAHVPSVYRALAATGLLREPWHAIGPFLASAAGRALAERVRTAAEEEARGFPRVAFFRAESARPILDEFRAALPRSLLFVAAASSEARR